LMDEPLGALDKRLRETMQYEIMRLHRELKLTIVYVTHDQGEALTMSDRVAVFSDGCIQQVASPTDLYENATNAFVANFVGENNSLEGKVVNVNGNLATLALPGGTVIYGRCGDGLRSNDPAALALRPERTRLGQGNRETDNVLTARVNKLIYCGDHHRIELTLDQGVNVIAKVPNIQHHELPAIGDDVSVCWRHDDCKILHVPLSDAIA